MKITTLTIENFMAIGTATVKLDDRGLVLIQGQNDDDASADSNGAGKSSIPDALCWALFGVTARGISGDAVVNRKAGKGAKVAVEIINGDDERYFVTRHRKCPAPYRNALVVEVANVAGGRTDLSKGTDKETQKVVEQIVGCSYDVFRSAVYAGQEQMPDLPAMTDRPLKMLVEEAAGITVIEAAYEIARKRVSFAETDVNNVAVRVDRYQGRVAYLEDELARNEDDHKAWDAARKDAIATLKADVAALIEDTKTLKLALGGMGETALREELDEVSKRIASVKSEDARREELAQVLSDAMAEESGFRARLAMAARSGKDAKTSLETVGDRVGSPCGECGKLYTEADVAEARALAARRYETAKAELRMLKTSADAASERVRDAQSALDSFVATMTDVSEASERQREIFNALGEIDRQKGMIDRKTAEARRLVEDVKAKQVEVNPHAAARKRIEETLADERLALEDSKEEFDEESRKLDTLKAAVDVFGPSGVRAVILDTVTPFLNERTAHYLGALSDGNIQAAWSTLSLTKKGEVREKFEIVVTNETGAESFAGLSGGEKRKARLATALALQDLVASRAVKPIDLWIGDEIDDALDVAGLERLMTILEEKARDRGSVLVISHNSLRDWIRETLLITKKDGVSTICAEERA